MQVRAFERYISLIKENARQYPIKQIKIFVQFMF